MPAFQISAPSYSLGGGGLATQARQATQATQATHAKQATQAVGYIAPRPQTLAIPLHDAAIVSNTIPTGLRLSSMAIQLKPVIDPFAIRLGAIQIRASVTTLGTSTEAKPADGAPAPGGGAPAGGGAVIPGGAPAGGAGAVEPVPEPRRITDVRADLDAAREERKALRKELRKLEREQQVERYRNGDSPKTDQEIDKVKDKLRDANKRVDDLRKELDELERLDKYGNGAL